MVKPKQPMPVIYNGKILVHHLDMLESKRLRRRIALIALLLRGSMRKKGSTRDGHCPKPERLGLLVRSRRRASWENHRQRRTLRQRQANSRPLYSSLRNQGTSPQSEKWPQSSGAYQRPLSRGDTPERADYRSIQGAVVHSSDGPVQSLPAHDMRGVGLARHRVGSTFLETSSQSILICLPPNNTDA